MSVHDYKKYDPYYSIKQVFGGESQIDFRYLFQQNKVLGLKILESLPLNISLELGNIVHIGEVSIQHIKSIKVKNILETTMNDISLEGLNHSIKKIDFNFEI